MHAIAQRGCTDTIRESALNVDSVRKIPFHTEESNPSRRRAGPMLYQLSYIPTYGLLEGTSVLSVVLQALKKKIKSQFVCYVM